jgi:hypothetical protein
VFGSAIDCSKVRLKRRRWFLFQPVGTLMAPSGHIHFHPRSPHWCDDFAHAPVEVQGLFLHEMTHVWQAQTKGPWYLPLWRNFSRRYDYTLRPGAPLSSYGIEQQAEIVRNAFLLRKGWKLAGVSDAAAYDALVRFPGAGLPAPMEEKQDSVDV